ncbi:2-hydroxyacid dehydrogenase [Novosphingobium cyanobacteriorum]|uniref:2-hydroxyacid dehydrogenase n=1 Tax=Novosphingobium cyanobacteriorum TaxID=3024215 RepID=A0ABT6CGQ2_9SPHN|nr:2-hydroxyacid dehydrogenase [Novosphingobium cyanobacteriorum]MDF8332997.1 2-hydroxyacid dehydrogenase [Novosphingobium cyanobacteriorum]
MPQAQKPEILAAAPLPPFTMADLETRFTVRRLWESLDSATLARIPAIAASTLAGGIGEDLFTRMPALRIIANFGVGYDNIDVAAAVGRGIMVTNTPGVLDEEVADLAMGLLLATLRRLPQADRFVREGRWPQGAFPLSPSLRGRKVGILGLGGIGKAIARRLDASLVKVTYHGRTRLAGVPYEYFATPVALAEACDVLIAILPGGAQTRHIVNAEVLAALGPQGVFINVARGSVVDQVALVHALQQGTILAAGLDVYEDEPQVPAELMELDNVVLLPHLGSASLVTRSAMGRLMADNLSAWFETGRPLTTVAECSHLLPG